MILVSKFIDHDVELEFLRNRYRSEKPELKLRSTHLGSI